MVGVICYDLAGKLVWRHDLGSYRTFANWGTASSPALDGNRLFILCGNDVVFTCPRRRINPPPHSHALVLPQTVTPPMQKNFGGLILS